MTLFLFTIYLYLACGITFYGAKRAAYNACKHTISELGESGSLYEKQVSYYLFFPVGFGCLLVANGIYEMNEPAAFIIGSLGVSYFLSAFFPCDPGTPAVGSWKNILHNIIAAICYAGIAYQLNELSSSHAPWHIQLSFSLLCTLLILFVIGLPKHLIGLLQRVTETSIFLSVFLLLLD